MKKSHMAGALCASVFVMTTSADAALTGVLPATPGGTDWQAVYDDDLDVTWIADAGLSMSMSFGIGDIITGVGTMDWFTANDWIQRMNAANYLGFNDWRLPVTVQPDPDCSGTLYLGDGVGMGCTASEMGHLRNIEGITDAMPGPFSNVQRRTYWSGTSLASDNRDAWTHAFGTGTNGRQSIRVKLDPRLTVWAVRSGNVSAVPVPAAAWLFGSGLLGLVGVARRKKS